MTAEHSTRKIPNSHYFRAIAWVMDDCPYLSEINKATLTEMPTRERFFEFLPELDYEVKGGTLDEPLWAWMKHPWFEDLGLTVDECLAFFQGRP